MLLKTFEFTYSILSSNYTWNSLLVSKARLISPLKKILYLWVNCFVVFISSGTFMSASEDKTGTLDIIEGKIARATMIPRTHGEV